MLDTPPLASQPSLYSRQCEPAGTQLPTSTFYYLHHCQIKYKKFQALTFLFGIDSHSEKPCKFNSTPILLSLLRLSMKEGNVLFNDALSTFYLRLCGVRHMIKDHSLTREETRCRDIGYSFRLAARVLLYAPSHIQDCTACITPVVEHWLEREIAQWVHHKGSIYGD